MASFSVGLKLADLDDFIAPSQECIKPVEIAKKRQAKVCKPSGQASRWLACPWAQPTQALTIELDDDGGYLQVAQDGSATRLAKAAITLNDCLACR